MTDPWISCSGLCYQCFSMPASRVSYQSLSPTFHKGGNHACHMKSVPSSQNLQLSSSARFKILSGKRVASCKGAVLRTDKVSGLTPDFK